MAALHRSISLLVWCMVIPSKVNGNVDIGDFFPFGDVAGDSTVPAADDTFAGPIVLRQPFSFFNVSQTSLFVNNNGAVSFAQGVSQFTPTCGALPASLSMVAPFWADVHNNQSMGGAVYYRETTDRVLLQKAASDIQTAFPNLWGLSIGWLFVSTWYETPFFGAASCGGPPQRNTFQSILATDGQRSFAIFYYNKITWTTGTASGGNCTGTGGNPAKAGFDVGDGITFFEVPGSCTQDIINIEDQSNIGVPGKFIFKVDRTFESTTCDDAKYQHERLQITPSFVTVFGHVPITLKGPCVNASATLTCRFNDPGQASVDVTGTFQLINGTPSVECIVPYLYSFGRIQVDLITIHSGSQATYSGFVYVTEPVEEVEVDVEVTSSGEWSILMNWEPDYFPAPTGRLSLVLLEYDVASKRWVERAILDDNIENLGTARITVTPIKVTSFIAFSLRMKKPHPDGTSSNDFYMGAASRLMCSQALMTFDNDIACQTWYDEDDGPPRDVLPCPPLFTQAIQDERFEREEVRYSLDYLNPGAEFSFRQRTPSPTGAGQQCTYKDGRLILGPLAGGTSDAVSPVKSTFEHWRRDVVPWCKCCAYSERPDSCRKYYEKRPSDTGGSYVPPRSAIGSGDPHITTFDLTTYTFNGVGEFWIIKSNGFSMQARMEQFVKVDGTVTQASVFTAFVMKDTTSIQVQLSQSNGIDILLDGERISFDKKHRSLHTNNAAITASENFHRVTVSLATGYSFAFTSVENWLSITAFASDRNKGETRGLLGGFDGSSDNDLEAPDGTITLPSASMSDIHYNFGLKWMIRSDESLFTYSDGKTYADYSNPSFVPNFVIPALNTLPQEVHDLCQNSPDCLYDYATTGSLSLANHTRQVEQEFNATVAELNQPSQMCRDIASPANGYANVTSLFAGSEVPFECNRNYTLVGDRKLACSSSLQWSSQAPICVDCSEEGALRKDPRDPKKFFHCSHGVAYSKKCRSVMSFNPSTKVCEWPESMKCKENPLSPRCRIPREVEELQ